MGLFRKRKGISKRHWRSLYGTWLEEDYRKKRKLLDEAGIDYRVWMDENEPSVVFRREYFGDPVTYRRYYNFYVIGRDFKKGCRVLNIDARGSDRGGISAIFF